MNYIIKKRKKALVTKIKNSKKFHTNVSEMTMKRFEVLTDDGELAIEFFADIKNADQNELIKKIIEL
jgi:hypothetical protein